MIFYLSEMNLSIMKTSTNQTFALKHDLTLLGITHTHTHTYTHTQIYIYI